MVKLFRARSLAFLIPPDDDTVIFLTALNKCKFLYTRSVTLCADYTRL